MMRSLFSGVSGLKNHQTRMDVIGNNISNVNTTGFKSSRVTFTDTLNQTLSGASTPTENLGGTNPKQIGLGSAVGSVDLLFTDGSVQSTGKNTDLCLSGSGLFVVKSGQGTYYTRNGAFEFDAAGNYVLPGSGMFVQGWMASDGTLLTTGEPGNIQIEAGKSMASKATKKIDYTLNLNASTPTITSIAVTNNAGVTTTLSTAGQNSAVDGTNVVSLVLSLSDGTSVTLASPSDVHYTVGNSTPVSTAVTVYDSLGNAHKVPIMIEKTGANNWVASLNGQTGGNSKVITESDNSTTTLTLSATNIPFKTDGSYDASTGSAATLNLAYANGNGAAAQSATIDFSALTQYAGTSTVKGSADGNAAGNLKSLAVDSTGTITGTYTNGIVQAEAQVAIAQFNNPSGLTKTGSSLYQVSNNSGAANVKTATDLGCTITPSALEMSNVDMANEFSDMIITQRGFQSNSKIITTSDEMLETLVNMKR